MKSRIPGLLLGRRGLWRCGFCACMFHAVTTGIHVLPLLWNVGSPGVYHVQVRRVTKVVKGGKQLSFRAVVVVGKEGQVGVGVGKAKEVVTAVQKAVKDARRHMVMVPMTKYKTFPHRAQGRFGSATVMLRPAATGTGVIAGGGARGAGACGAGERPGQGAGEREPPEQCPCCAGRGEPDEAVPGRGQGAQHSHGDALDMSPTFL